MSFPISLTVQSGILHRCRNESVQYRSLQNGPLAIQKRPLPSKRPRTQPHVNEYDSQSIADRVAPVTCSSRTNDENADLVGTIATTSLSTGSVCNR
jgi:hypothetical protein